MNLETFLRRPARAADFDFKALMGDYYQSHAGRHTRSRTYPNILRETAKVAGARDHIRRWYLYRTADETYYPRKYRFDCDSSNGTCGLTDEIYGSLWGDLAASGRFGGDTMHSFAYPFNAFSGTRGFRTGYERYRTDREFRDRAREALGEYARRVGCVGNFVLVPLGYNRARGFSTALADYWDLSLDALKRDKDGKGWLKKAGLPFGRYINRLFLWEDVEPDGTGGYRVRPLFPGHGGLMGGGRPRSPGHVRPTAQEVEPFVRSANSCIRRRSVFTVAMLRIARAAPADYARLVEAVFDTDRCLGTTEQVVERLRAVEGLSKKTGRILGGLVLPAGAANIRKRGQHAK